MPAALATVIVVAPAAAAALSVVVALTVVLAAATVNGPSLPICRACAGVAAMPAKTAASAAARTEQPEVRALDMVFSRSVSCANLRRDDQGECSPGTATPCRCACGGHAHP
jgi:hypothetical protein